MPRSLDMKTMNRREILGAATIGLPTMALAASAERASATSPPREAKTAGAGGAAAFAGRHQPVPLPFDPAKLAGLSERMIVSHHDNNYAGAVKNLNKCEEQIAATNKDTPGFVVHGLRERELLFSNSLIMHEHYFANLGGNGKPGGAIATALDGAFGGAARWEELFRSTGMSLSGGSGWTVLDYNFLTNDPRIYWAGNHTQGIGYGKPLLVLDMYEHAYQMDYGAAAAKYVDAFMQNVNWDEVNRRYEHALAAAKVLRG